MRSPTGGEAATSTSNASARLRELATTSPTRAVIEGGAERVTYAELDADVDATVARFEADLGPGRHHVGLRMLGTRALLTVSTALARAGLVSVPIDPTAPPERVSGIASDAELVLIITDVPGDQDLALGAPTVPAEGYRLDPTHPSVDVAVPLDEVVGILFTSGSTGVPKGIAIGPATRDAQGVLRDTVLADNVRAGVLEIGTLGFSEHLLQTLVILGATMVPYAIRTLGLAPMAAWLQDERIEGMVLVPTILRFLVPTLDPEARFPDLRYLVLASEASTWEDVDAIRPHLAPDPVILNIYGTSETGPNATFFVPSGATGTGLLPAGQPMPNIEIDVIDEDGKPVPVGAVGEVVVTGTSVGLGYWRRPDLTAAAYEVLPDGRRRCRSGDAGRLSADGSLEIRGRLDHVAKVNGNRVDLGDVESGLTRDDALAAAAIATETDENGITRLIAYVVAAGHASPTTHTVRNELARRLPGYMLPSRIVFVSSLPQLPNGKVDRSSLGALIPLPEPSAGGPATAADPFTERLAALWRQVLELDTVQPHDDFFEIGGDSMRAAQLFAEIERELGVSHRISLLLDAPTLSTLAAALRRPSGRAPVLLPLRTTGDLPPLFVVHGGMGDILFARELAGLLGDDQPVYAIQPPALVDGGPTDQTLEALAGRYVDLLQGIVGNDPARLFGFSFGGTVAFEMALQRQAAGASDDTVFIGDTPAPSIEAATFEGYRSAGQETRGVRGTTHRALARAASLARQGPRRGLSEGVGVARRAARRSYDRMTVPWWFRRDLSKGEEVLNAYGPLLRRYQPAGRFSGSTVVIVANRTVELGMPVDLGWSRHVLEAPRIVPVNARHGNLMHQPQVRHVALAIAEG
ncbi:hypothetical protein BH10ACT1_BH10ACT1_08130 [soil metagenome]